MTTLRNQGPVRRPQSDPAPLADMSSPIRGATSVPGPATGHVPRLGQKRVWTGTDSTELVTMRIYIPDFQEYSRIFPKT